MEKIAPDLMALNYAKDPKVIFQLKAALVLCAIVVFSALILWGAPILFALAIGGFFLLPLTAIKAVTQKSEWALEAYEKGKSFEGTAAWSGHSWSDSIVWTGEMDLGDGGKWRIKIDGGTKGHKAFRKMKMDSDTTGITAWLHPVTGQPRMIQLNGQRMSVDDVTEVMTKLRTEK